MLDLTLSLFSRIFFMKNCVLNFQQKFEKKKFFFSPAKLENFNPHRRGEAFNRPVKCINGQDFPDFSISIKRPWKPTFNSARERFLRTFAYLYTSRNNNNRLEIRDTKHCARNIRQRRRERERDDDTSSRFSTSFSTTRQRHDDDDRIMHNTIFAISQHGIFVYASHDAARPRTVLPLPPSSSTVPMKGGNQSVGD